MAQAVARLPAVTTRLTRPDRCSLKPRRGGFPAATCRNVAALSTRCEQQEPSSTSSSSTATSSVHNSLSIQSSSTTAAPPAGLTTGRRALLASSLCPIAALLADPKPPAAKAGMLKSLKSDARAALTFYNNTDSRVRVYWVNYDGDAELYVRIPPGGVWTVDTFATHPWRTVLNETGIVLRTYVAAPGQQMIDVAEPDEMLETIETEMELEQAAEEETEFEYANSFDGIGGEADAYASAQLSAVVQIPSSAMAVLVLSVDGFEAPLPVPASMLDLESVVSAAQGERGRQPDTFQSWSRALHAVGGQVDRVTITRLVGHQLYARIVLSAPSIAPQAQFAAVSNRDPARNSSSINVRPPDAIALAIRSGVPIYVCKDIVEVAAHARLGLPEVDETEGALKA
eukprot:jgi/Chlat1/7696/Chrsp64S07150